MSTHAFYLGGGSLSVGIAETEIEEIRATLSAVDVGADKVIKSAINDTLKHGRAALTKRMRDHLKLKASDIRDRISIKQQATDDNLVGVLSIDYRPVPLMDFKPSFRKRQGVFVTTVKEEGPQNFKHQFRARMASGHTGAFEREQFTPKRIPAGGGYTLAARKAKQLANAKPGRKLRALKPVVARQSIREAFGPSIMRAFELAPGLAEEALADLDAYFRKRLDSKIQWQLDKAQAEVPAAV